ncbi:MAG: NAD(P)/FAD-dependent oxidoreductase, partial [Gemmatimonadaceae bacterium]
MEDANAEHRTPITGDDDVRNTDIVIVGGGPAGLSAAIWLGRYLHRVVLVDSGDPRNWQTRGIHGYLGIPVCTPAELRASGRDEARKYGVVLIDDEVCTIEHHADERFRFTLNGGAVIESRRVLLAFGIKDIWPNVPGLEHVYGDTAHHCPDCDGYEARDKKVVVIASGRSAVGMALSLTTWTRQIVICTDGQPADIDAVNLAKLDALNIPVLETKITGLRAQASEVRSLDLEGGMVLDCERIFFAVGQYPADDLAERLGCTRDHEGLV